MPNIKSKAALELLEKLLPKGSSLEEQIALRQNPEKLKQYLSALDQAYGPVEARMKLMDFGTKDWYHGTTSKKPIKEFRLSKDGTYGPGVYFTDAKSSAENYASDIDNIYQVKLKNTRPINMDQGDWPMSQIRQEADAAGVSVDEYLKSQGVGSLESRAGVGGTEKTILNPEHIRSIDAAFDPRFADSPYIMAGGVAIPAAGAAPDMGAPVRELAQKYANTKKAVADTAAQQMGRAFHSSPEDVQNQSEILNMALDPANLLPGAAGAAAAVLPTGYADGGQVGSEVQVVSPNGDLGSVPADQLQDALSSGYRQPTPEDLQRHEQSSGIAAGQAFIEGGLSAATLGLAGPIQQSLIKQVDPAQAKRMFIEEQQRAEANPVARMGGELAGLGVSGVLGAGATPIMELAGAKAASAVANPIGSMAAKMAVENMVFQAGSEVDKHFWQNADSAQSALVEVGLAGILGGVTGAGLGGVKELWKLGPGKQLQQTLEGLTKNTNGVPTELASKAGIDLAPEVAAAMGESKAAQSAAAKLMDAGSKQGAEYQALVKGAQQDIANGIPEILGQSLEDVSSYEGGVKLKNALTGEMKKIVAPIAEKYEQFEEKFAKQALSMEDRAALGDMVSDIMAKSGINKDPYSAEAALYRRMAETMPLQENLDDLRKIMSRLGEEHPFGKDTYFAAKQIRSELQNAFENILERKVKVNAPTLLEDFAITKQEYGKFKELLSDLNDRLHMGKRAEGGITGFVKALEEAKPEQILKRLNLKEDVGLQKLLTEKFPDIAEMRRQQEISDIISKSLNADRSVVDPKKLFKRIADMEPEYRNYLMNAEQQGRLEAVQQLLEKLPVGANTSRTSAAMEKWMKDLLPGAAGVAAATVAHMGPIGSLLAGGLAAAGKDAPDAIRLAMLKFIGSNERVSAPGFKAAVDMAQSILRGESKLQQGAKAVFGKAAPVVASFSATDREKLQKRIDALAKNPQDALHVGGDSGHYLPDHNASMVAASARAVQYLQSIKPVEQQSGLLGKPLPVNAVAQQKYDRALEIANNPQVVLADIRRGTLAPDDIRHLSAMYPQLMQRMQNLVQTEMIEAKNDGEHVPFKVQQALSLFLNQPIHGALTPASIQSTQPQATQPMPPAQQMLPKGPRNMNKLDKLPGMSSTPMQHREAFRTGSHK